MLTPKYLPLQVRWHPSVTCSTLVTREAWWMRTWRWSCPRRRQSLQIWHLTCLWAVDIGPRAGTGSQQPLRHSSIGKSICGSQRWLISSAWRREWSTFLSVKTLQSSHLIRRSINAPHRLKSKHASQCLEVLWRSSGGELAICHIWWLNWWLLKFLKMCVRMSYCVCVENCLDWPLGGSTTLLWTSTVKKRQQSHLMQMFLLTSEGCVCTMWWSPPSVLCTALQK